MGKIRLGFKARIILATAAVLAGAVLWGIYEEKETDRQHVGTDAAYDSFGKGQKDKHMDRQAVVSLAGAEGAVYISWKGQNTGPEYVRISETREELPSSVHVKGRGEKALGGHYCRYTAKIEDLQVGKRYYYEIGDGVFFDSPESFRLPDGKGSISFLYLGDVQFDLSVSEYGSWEKMTRKIYDSNPRIQFAVIGGDMVNTPTEEKQWNGFLNGCSLFSGIPLMTVSGNHEGVSSNKTYKKMFEVPHNGPRAKGELKNQLQEDFYYFDCGSCRFIMTDSSFLTEERQKKLGKKRWEAYEAAIEEWLRKTLKGSDKQWNIVVTHHPPYGMHDKNTVSPQLRELWTPIMEEAGADLVLCGHQHMYMRTKPINGITYIMGNSGGRVSEFYNGYNAPSYCEAVYGESANYQIIEADEEKLKITSYNKKGLIIDEAVMKKSLWLHILEFFSCHKIIVQSAQMDKVI